METSAFFFDIAVFMLVVAFTSLVGLPFSRGFKLLSRASLAFPLGFAVISFSGAAADVLGLPVFDVQAFVCVLSISALAFSCRGGGVRLDALRAAVSSNRLFLLVLFFFTFESLYFYSSSLVMWKEGDGSFHGSLIRVLLDGGGLPFSVRPVTAESPEYLAFYPKFYHLFAFFHAKLLGLDVFRAMKLVAVSFVILTSLNVYALTARIGLRRYALFAFVFSLLFFIRFFPLVWMGYPSLAGEMLLVSTILMLLLELEGGAVPLRWLFLVIAMFFTHPLHLIFGIPVFAYVLAWKLRARSNMALTAAMTSAIFLVGFSIFFRVGLPKAPENLYVLMHPFLLPPLWDYPAFGVLNFMIITVYAFFLLVRDVGPVRLPANWIVCQSVLYLLLQFQVIPPLGTDVRYVATLYLPLSMIWAVIAGKFLEEVSAQAPSNISVGLLSTGVIVMLLLYSLPLQSSIQQYFLGWRLDESDLRGMEALEGKGGVCVNLDYSGRWVYPIAGMRVTNPRVLPQLVSDPVPHYTLLPKRLRDIADNPDSNESLDVMDGLRGEYGRVFVYISKGSIDGDYSIFELKFPRIDSGKFRVSKHYRVVYDEGSFVAEYVGR